MSGLVKRAFAGVSKQQAGAIGVLSTAILAGGGYAISSSPSIAWTWKTSAAGTHRLECNMADLTSEAKRAACLSRLELTTAGVMERMVGEIKTTRPASYDRPVHGIGQDYIKDISLSVSEMEKQCNKIRSTAAENDRIRELDGCLFHMNIVSGYYDGWGHSAEAVVETISSGLQEIQSGMKPALML